MKARHFLSLCNLGSENLARIVDRSLAIACGRDRTRPLEGKAAGIYFRKTSTRTRTAFSVGAMRLGADVIQYGPDDLQINTGETVQDTARVLSGFLDILVVRTNESHEEMALFAGQDQMAVVNAMSEREHPTQAIADLVTIREAFGRLADIHVLYMGEGNNSAVALALAIAQAPGMQLTLVTPEGYGLPEGLLDVSRALAAKNGAVIEQRHDLLRLPLVDVVYTTRWLTMGAPKSDPLWREKFEPFQITPELMERVSKSSRTVFLHDLPAMRGSEVVDDVLDGPQSLAFRQAQHKLTSAMSVLAWCLGEQ